MKTLAEYTLKEIAELCKKYPTCIGCPCDLEYGCIFNIFTMDSEYFLREAKKIKIGGKDD